NWSISAYESSAGNRSSDHSAGNAGGAAACLPARRLCADSCSFPLFGERIERLDAVFVQPQPGMGALTRLEGQHVAPVRLGQIAISGQYADITATLLHRQF